MEKIEKVNTKDHIVYILRKEIISGNIKPNEELTQENVAKALGVSRMPIREAFQTLEEEGFLEKLPNRHVIVNPINSKKILNIFKILIAIEMEIIEILLEENIKIESLKLILKEKDLSYKEKCDIEMKFHENLVKFIHDKGIEQLYMKLLKGYMNYIIYELEHDVDYSFVQLEKILNYYEKKDKKEIKNILKDYYIKMADILLEHWRNIVKDEITREN